MFFLRCSFAHKLRKAAVLATLLQPSKLLLENSLVKFGLCEALYPNTERIGGGAADLKRHRQDMTRHDKTIPTIPAFALGRVEVEK